MCNGYSGCTTDELTGKNWGPLPYVVGDPMTMHWEFRDGAAFGVEVNPNGSGSRSDILRVTSNGPALTDLVWEHRYFDNYGVDHGFGRASDYISFNPDFSVIVYGFAQPESKKRRQFVMYKTP